MERRRATPKYGNRKTNGYDSRLESRRAQQLKIMEAAGLITDLQEQVKFVLIPTLYDEDENGKQKIVERACAYVADFTYVDKETGEYVVEDTKGVKTAEYVIKRKLMLYLRGIAVREITSKGANASERYLKNLKT